LPIARAQLVGLERVEDAQHLGHAAADAQIVHAHPANRPRGIDDERGAQRDPLRLVQDAERGRQLALRIGQHGEGDVLQGRVRLTPGEVHVMRIRARAEHLRVARGELGVGPPELGDLGRADEREVHRPEEEHQPFAGVALVRDLLKLLPRITAHDGLNAKRGQLVSDGQHVDVLLLWIMSVIR
jgi:hypothetical protein